MTILSTIQSVCQVLALPYPTAVIGTTDVRALQMLRLANQEVQAHTSRHAWSVLQTVKEATLTATDYVATHTLPTDFRRFVRDGKIWHTDRNIVIRGPVNEMVWEASTGGSAGAAQASPIWRKIGSNSIQIAGVSTDDAITYDYISTYGVVAADTTTFKAAFTVDTDVVRTSEHLLELGLIWRFLKQNNLDYAEEMSNYEREFERLANEDRGEIGIIRLAGSNRGWKPDYLAVTVSAAEDGDDDLGDLDLE
jgi:hypothetical protein